MITQYRFSWMNWWLMGSCLISLGNSPASSQNLTGQQIYNRMLRVYAEAATYQDVGRVTTDFYEIGQQHPKFTTIRTFETAYNRPTHQFRFHYKTEDKFSSRFSHEMVIWTKGNETYRWWSISDSTVHEPVSYALSAATGVSGTASRKIPGLLLNQSIAGWGIDSLKNIKLIGKDIQDNRLCYRISGVYWKNKVAFLWIDQQSFLVVRLDEGMVIPGQKVKMSMTYRPTINMPIPVEKLQFQPPNAAK